MTTHYVTTLGVAKCREILRGAPDKTASHYFMVKGMYLKERFDGVFIHIENNWISSNYPLNGMLRLTNLRLELSLHDSDDYTHLENHISPNTKVVG